jgi:hypothetical protein
METDAMRLDGNAIGGLMLELFGKEMTASIGVCGSCGAVERLACVDVYLHAPGTIVRCRHCQSVLMKVVQTPTRFWIDLSGLRSIELRVP